ADDVAVELGDDLRGREGEAGHSGSVRDTVFIVAGTMRPAWTEGGLTQVRPGSGPQSTRRSGSYAPGSQDFHCHVLVRVDADRRGDAHRFGRDRLPVPIRVGDERAGGSQRVGTTRTDTDQAVV